MPPAKNFFAILLMGLPLVGCQPEGPGPSAADSRQPESVSEPVSTQSTDRQLFDGKSLDGWKKTNFGGEGDVEVVNGQIVLSMGYPMTGVTWAGSNLPTRNYEISLEAKRIEGTDFFCGLTFPVNDSHCSLIAGGWGGTLVGLSCIDGFDASGNATRQHRNFDNNRWYKFRVRVKPDTITAWIDDEEIIHQNIVDREISVRNETLPCRPLGICSFETKAACRNILLSVDPLSVDPTTRPQGNSTIQPEQ